MLVPVVAAFGVADSGAKRTTGLEPVTLCLEGRKREVTGGDRS
jgi:hypothetical protein